MGGGGSDRSRVKIEHEKIIHKTYKEHSVNSILQQNTNPGPSGFVNIKFSVLYQNPSRVAGLSDVKQGFPNAMYFTIKVQTEYQKSMPVAKY